MTRMTPSEAFVETLAAQAMQMLNYDFPGLFARPIAAVLLGLAIATAAYNIYQAVGKAARPAA